PPRYNGGLLDQAQRDQIDVVLVSPRNPLNIGAAARAMANFGFARLTVVAPFEDHWREARSAVGAPEVLAEAREAATLPEALAECTLAIGTGTVSARRPEQPVAALPDLAPLVERELRKGGRIAIAFGSEKRGLTRENLSRCHLLVEIPTDARQPSMNLGQAVAVCLYELATRVNLSGVDWSEASRSDGRGIRAPEESSAARGAEIDMLADVIAGTMEAARYSPAAMRGANRHDVLLLLRRLNLTSSDLKRALGLFRRILWRLKQQP
ncbi:MAG: RNA methyltransferase, partial [Terracidiphilus sp.]